MTLFLWVNLGVPISTQWGPRGYFYPIQIAQYGLSHYSKNLTEKPPSIKTYGFMMEEREGSPNPWTVPKGCSIAKVHDPGHTATIYQFTTPGKCSIDELLKYKEDCSLMPDNNFS